MDRERLEKLIDENKLSVLKDELTNMNDYDVATLIEDLPEKQLIKVFRLLPKDKATDVFVNMEDEVQRH